MADIWMKNPNLLRQAIDTEKRQASITSAALAGGQLNTITSESSGVDISLIVWPTLGGRANTPELDEYGFAHAKHTAQLATYIAQGMGIAGKELEILNAAAFMHDIGRQAPWTESDPHHAQRSAELADDVMKRSKWWGEQAIREQVCRLIAQHTLTYDTPPRDPLAIALHDADCYEAARLLPNDPKGLDIMVRRHKQCVSEWALDMGHHRRWRDQYWR